MKVIIADDDSMVRDIYQDIVKSLSKDIAVDTVENGEDLVEKVKQNNYDLIISDNNMGPGIRGLEAIKEIRKFNSKVPICLASGDDLEDLALSAGASRYVFKPDVFKVLEDVIKEYLVI